MSFKLAAGESLGILGKTGAGKSTITSLIVRQYDPNSGQILVDGIDPNTMAPSYLKKSYLGWVPQEAFLFSDTISRNISFGLDESEEKNIQNAAKAAGVHENIVEFPNAYETKVGERGVTLSGGQKQRISIARALAKNPKLMVFDDCLSAVDTETEELILGNIKQATSSISSLIIYTESAA